MNDLQIQICNSPKEAPDYNKTEEEFRYAKLCKAIVVKNGTEGGRSTVDLQFEDAEGNKYIAMITARLLKQVATIVKFEN